MSLGSVSKRPWPASGIALTRHITRAGRPDGPPCSIGTLGSQARKRPCLTVLTRASSGSDHWTTTDGLPLKVLGAGLVRRLFCDACSQRPLHLVEWVGRESNPQCLRGIWAAPVAPSGTSPVLPDEVGLWTGHRIPRCLPVPSRMRGTLLGVRRLSGCPLTVDCVGTGGSTWPPRSARQILETQLVRRTFAGLRRAGQPSQHGPVVQRQLAHQLGKRVARLAYVAPGRSGSQMMAK